MSIKKVVVAGGGVLGSQIAFNQLTADLMLPFGLEVKDPSNVQNQNWKDSKTYTLKH